MKYDKVKSQISELCAELPSETATNEEDQKLALDLNNIIAKYSSKVETDIFTWICKSIIEGDYIGQQDYKSNLNEIKEDLETFRSRLLGLPNPINDNNLDASAQIVNTIDLNEIIRPVLLCIDRINVLIDQIEKRDKLEFHKPLFIVNDESYYLDAEISQAYRYASDINSLLIGLEYYDHFLTVDHNTLKNLAFINTRINDKCLIDPMIMELMRIKCHVLIKKILLRLDEDKIYSYRYVHNYQDKQLSDFKEPLSRFTDIDDLIDNHYKDDIEGNSKANIELKARPILQNRKKFVTLKYSEYQILAKYYKDKIGDNKELVHLRELFCSENIENDESVKYIFNTCNQYLLNNCLSLFIEKEDEQGIRGVYDTIKLLESENGIYNYFPHLYFCKYLKKKLNKIIDSKDDIKQFNTLVEEFSKVKKQAYKAYEWCKDRDFMSYRVPFEECLFSDGEGIEQRKLHIASSYILPNNYEQIKLELDELSSDYQRFITLDSAIKETIKLSEEVNSAKKAFDNAEKKNIEILSIFSAIVLFVAGEIQLFRFVTSAHNAVMYTLILGFCISLFVLLIWIITREKNSENSNYLIMILLALGVAGSLIYVYTNPYPELPKIKEYDEAISKIKRLEKRIAQDSVRLLKLEAK